MPIGILIIKWDNFEGAVPYFKYPPDFEVQENYIQQIQISHNLISSIMVHKDDKVNAISYYNEEHGKTIALFLSKYDDGQDYYEIINQMNDVLLKSVHNGTSEEEIFNDIIRIYDLSFSVFKVREQVLMKLANEVSSLKGVEHDFNKRVNKILELTGNQKLRILLVLTLHETMKTSDLFRIVKGKRPNFYKTIRRLEENELIKRVGRNSVQLMF